MFAGWGRLGFVVGVGLTAVFSLTTSFLSTSVWQPIIAIDTAQQRLNQAAPIPQGQFFLTQTFVPRRNGLTEVEVRLVGVEKEGENGRFSLHLFDSANQLVAQHQLDTQALEHNQTVRLHFAPQSQSARQTYRLQISGDQNNTFSVWGYDLDVYAGGTFALFAAPLSATPLPSHQIADIQFTVRYQLGWADVWSILAETLLHEGGLILAAFFVLSLPGCLLLLWYGEIPCLTIASAWWGMAVALGIVGWVLIWYGVTLLGGYLTPWLLWLLLLGGWAAVIWLWRQPTRQRLVVGLADFGLLLLLLLGLAVRMLAVRDVSFPLWVDSSRHALITAVMVVNGRSPTNYAPFLPIDRFPYHFGFHTLAASLMLLTKWPLPRLLLVLGQLLNGLVPLTIYTSAWMLWRRHTAALLATFLVALPFFFPGYYATWGRMTQLTAVLLFPPLLAATWNLLAPSAKNHHYWWLVGLLAAGLFLVHIRVFLFYLPFVGVAVFVHLTNMKLNGRWLLAATALGGTLAFPRIWQLTRITNPVTTVGYTIANYNAFPTSYITIGWEPYFLWAAGLILLVVLVAALRPARYANRRWTTLPLTVAAWVAVLFLLLAGERIGLPETTLVNLNSFYIILFIPLTLFLCGCFSQLWHWLEAKSRRWSHIVPVSTGVGLFCASLFGIHQQISILNPQTILAYPADMQGIMWVNAHLPPDAYIAVNSWRWLDNTWAGSDGGSWLLPLTGRATTTPPADYMYDSLLYQQVDAFNQAAASVDDWANPEQIDWLEKQGVTHIFVGVKGGFFDPSTLVKNPRLDIVYSQDGVFVFRIKTKI